MPDICRPGTYAWQMPVIAWYMPGKHFLHKIMFMLVILNHVCLQWVFAKYQTLLLWDEECILGSWIDEWHIHGIFQAYATWITKCIVALHQLLPKKYIKRMMQNLHVPLYLSQSRLGISHHPRKGLFYQEIYMPYISRVYQAYSCHIYSAATLKAFRVSQAP